MRGGGGREGGERWRGGGRRGREEGEEKEMWREWRYSVEKGKFRVGRGREGDDGLMCR